SDRMVVNAAFLVDRQNGLQLDDAVRRLNDEFNDRLMFKYFRTGTAVQFRQHRRQLGGSSTSTSTGRNERGPPRTYAHRAGTRPDPGIAVVGAHDRGAGQSRAL